MTDDASFTDRFRAAARSSERTVFWRHTRPAEDLDRLAKGCVELGVDEWDSYGSRGAVTMLETQVADLLGAPAALFVPSGTLAQQAVLRIWCDRSGSRRVALPDLSHLVHHEEDGPRRLHGLEWEFLTTGRRTPVAADLEAVPGRLGAALTELPLRDAGCLLPSWDDLVGLSTAAREGGVPLHLDGARLWEAQPFYDRPLDEVAGLFDSVYVSFYKGLGAQAGACVVADQDVVDELRSWRKRMGGTLFTMTPYAVGALLGLRDELPRMGEYADWARSLAAALPAQGSASTRRCRACARSRCTPTAWPRRSTSGWSPSWRPSARCCAVRSGRPTTRGRSWPSWPATPRPPSTTPRWWPGGWAGSCTAEARLRAVRARQERSPKWRRDLPHEVGQVPAGGTGAYVSR